MTKHVDQKLAPEYPCPKCGAEMKSVIFDGYGGGLECPKCSYQVLMDTEDEDGY